MLVFQADQVHENLKKESARGKNCRAHSQTRKPPPAKFFAGGGFLLLFSMFSGNFTDVICNIAVRKIIAAVHFL